MSYTISSTQTNVTFTIQPVSAHHKTRLINHLFEHVLFVRLEAEEFLYAETTCIDGITYINAITYTFGEDCCIDTIMRVKDLINYAMNTWHAINS